MTFGLFGLNQDRCWHFLQCCSLMKGIIGQPNCLVIWVWRLAAA